MHRKQKVCNDSFSNFCRPLNTWASSNFLLSVKYTSSYWLWYNLLNSTESTVHKCSLVKHIKKTFNQFKARQARHFMKHAILWSTPSTLFCVARQARHFMKHAKHTILRPTSSTLMFWTTPFYEARQARQYFEARQACHFMKHAKCAKHASTPFSILIFW